LALVLSMAAQTSPTLRVRPTDDTTLHASPLAVTPDGKSALPVETEPPRAEEIMARVAGNQDRSEELRKDYVYKQRIRIVTHKPKGRVMREETADYEVVALPDSTTKQLKLVTGRYWEKGKYVEFQGEMPHSNPDVDLIHNLRNHEPVPDSARSDVDLIHNLRNDLLNDKSKDGLARDLFPLTSEEQRSYQFKFLGQEIESGRNVYHIAFAPKDTEEPTWAGEAFIDAEEFEPVRVFTKMSRRIPLVARTMWFDLPGFGFDVVYERHEDGVWFPSSFGTEFQMQFGPLFFFNRDISISLENSGFQRKHIATN
jgi:hypothetical protein